MRLVYVSLTVRYSVQYLAYRKDVPDFSGSEGGFSVAGRTREASAADGLRI
jgi:hypothetical protein